MKATELHALLPDLSYYEVEYHPGDVLKRLALMRNGQCLAVLDVGFGQDSGEYRAGIAGERFAEGGIEPMGPFAGSAPGRAADMPFEEWVRSKINDMQRLDLEGGSSPRPKARTRRLTSLADGLWAFLARSVLVIGGGIIFLYGLDGIITGEILQAAGRHYRAPHPVELTGWGARIYGFIFAAAGFVLIAVAVPAIGKCLFDRDKRR